MVVILSFACLSSSNGLAFAISLIVLWDYLSCDPFESLHSSKSLDSQKSMPITLFAMKNNNNITSGGENEELNNINLLPPMSPTEKIAEPTSILES
jgi:hypothetical protein